MGDGKDGRAYPVACTGALWCNWQVAPPIYNNNVYFNDDICIRYVQCTLY